jgi:hypothetical protein
MSDPKIDTSSKAPNPASAESDQPGHVSKQLRDAYDEIFLNGNAGRRPAVQHDFFLIGKTGTGKSDMAKHLADLLIGDKKINFKFDDEALKKLRVSHAAHSDLTTLLNREPRLENRLVGEFFRFYKTPKDPKKADDLLARALAEAKAKGIKLDGIDMPDMPEDNRAASRLYELQKTLLGIVNDEAKKAGRISITCDAVEGAPNLVVTMSSSRMATTGGLTSVIIPGAPPIVTTQRFAIVLAEGAEDNIVMTFYGPAIFGREAFSRAGSEQKKALENTTPHKISALETADLTVLGGTAKRFVAGLVGDFQKHSRTLEKIPAETAARYNAELDGLTLPRGSVSGTAAPAAREELKR